MGPQGGDRLLFGESGRQGLADDAIEDHVRRIADDLRPDDGANDAAQRQNRGNRDPHPLRAKPRHQLAKRLAQVFGLLRWEHPAKAAARPATKPSARRRPPTKVARHHATASSPSWEATISRYASVVDISS